jgi:hypothetical protein
VLAVAVGVKAGVGVGVGEGVVPAVGVGVLPGVAVALTPLLQALPFTAKAVGTGLLVVQVPLNPGLTVPFAGTLPFQLALVTVTSCPDWLKVPFQPWVTLWPAAGKVKVRVQPFQAVPLVF